MISIDDGWTLAVMDAEGLDAGQKGNGIRGWTEREGMTVISKGGGQAVTGAEGVRLGWRENGSGEKLRTKGMVVGWNINGGGAVQL